MNEIEVNKKQTVPLSKFLQCVRQEKITSHQSLQVNNETLQ